MKYIELKNLARKAFPCKIFQGKHFLARSFKENFSLQDLARNKFPCKILQVIAFLQGSCKILARNAFFSTRVFGQIRDTLISIHFYLYFYMSKKVTGMKTFQMRMKIKVKTIENQRVPDLSKKRHRNENIPNADEN